MCRGLIGKKIGMLGYFTSEGEYIPVTVVQAGPCVVTQVKTVSIDGYNALQLSFGEQKMQRLNKPALGHFKKADKGFFKHICEVSVAEPDQYNLGEIIPLDIFKIGEKVNVTGKTKGRGFSGVIKRHGFHGGKKTHGSRSHRIPGSIGCSAWPGKVIKGKKMPGRYGNVQKTVKNLEIIDVRPEENLLFIKGALPGHNSSIISIKKQKN